MCKEDSKTESSHEESRAKNIATRDDPKGIFKPHNPESWISKLLDSKDLTAAKQWYRQNYDRDESRDCPACQDPGADLANLLSCAGTFKLAAPVGTLMVVFVGAYFAVLLKPDQSIIMSTIVQIMTSVVIATMVLIVPFVYWAAQRDSEERTKAAFKSMELPRMRMNKITTSTDGQEYYPQHQKLVPSGTY